MNDDSPRQYADIAMKLWEACLDERNSTKEFIALRLDHLEKDLQKQREIPNPEKFPVAFDDLLRLWIGGRNKDYRIKIYREYAKEMIWRGRVNAIKYPSSPDSPNKRYLNAVMSYEKAEKLARPVSPADIDSLMKEAAEKKIENLELYRWKSRDFLNWFSNYKATIRQKRARAGADGLKKKRQKNGQAE